MSKYYYIDDTTKRQYGPLEPAGLLSYGVKRETLVWQSGMSDWTKAEDVEELSSLFGSRASIPRVEKMEETGESNVLNQNWQNSTFLSDDQSIEQKSIPPMPKNWMVESVILSVLCCSPVSVVGIYNASKVERFYSEKKYDESLKKADLARNWALLGTLFLPVCYMIFFFFSVITDSFA